MGLNEHKAVKVINQFLETHNFTSQVGLTDLPELQTALRGDYNGTAQHKIAFLGEYDALPALGHGCGHNLIAIMSMGAAIAFSQTARDTWGTTFFGCPAEETIGGKVFMANGRAF